MVNQVRQFYRQRWAKWLDNRIPRRREVTLNQRRIFIFLSPQGVIMALVLLALFVGGINYGNNLLLGVCFFLGSLVVVTIHHTYANLSGLRISVMGTEPAFAGEKAGFWVRFASTSGREHQSLQLSWGDAEENLESVQAPQQAGFFITAPQRGLFHPPRLRIATFYPLGLLRAWTWLDLDMEAIVYPRPIGDGEIPLGEGNDGEGEVTSVPGIEDFDSLRQYTPGDNLAHISWRHAARGQGLLTKRFVDEVAGTDYLDWAAYQGMEGEARLSRLCWWVVTLSERNRTFGLRLPGVEVPLGTGPEHRDACLTALALHDRRPAHAG